MTRPLRYDDAFINILREKMHDKFLGMLTLKVQSTTFFQKLNLQKGLLVSSLLDITYGIIILILFVQNFNYYKSNSFVLENTIGILCLFFGLIGVDSALNLKKTHSFVYKNWRIAFTFLYVMTEIGNSFNFICFYTQDEDAPGQESCGWLLKAVYFLFIVTLSGYLTKIAWSFYVRLDQSHDLLIIHGKYLETMLNEDNVKYEVSKKYIPPNKLDKSSLTDKNSKIFISRENEIPKAPTEITADGNFRLFNNENQVTSGGNIRESLTRSLKNN